MKQKPIVQIKNLSKTIGKKTIIDDISFDVYPGEVYGFLGPNGAGKTTTIRMIVGLISITKGEILINGISIEKDFEKAISYVGGIVENPEMYKFLTGYQNLIHYARMQNVKKERLDAVIQLAGLENRIHDKVKTYSLGMRQRLGVAQALLHSPKLLILDEPTNGLDPAGIKELRDYLRKLAAEEGIAIMVSSHLLSEMELMCDRIGIIQNGKFIGVQKVKEFVEDEKGLSVQFTFDSNSIQQAKKCLEEFIPEQTLEINDENIVLKVEHEQIPLINKELVSREISVYGINLISKSLEDKFLEVTGGNQIV